MNDKYYYLNYDDLSENKLLDFATIVTQYPSHKFCLHVKNTKNITIDTIKKFQKLIPSNNLFIRIEGGYTEGRIKAYPSYYDMHKYDNIYTLSETIKILNEINNIEKGMQSNWSTEEKFIYLIYYLKNDIVYHPFHETEESKEIRSLRGLYSKTTVCAGYALIFKELCDRNGIPCQYVEGACNKKDIENGNLTHAWNIVNLNGHNIPIDLTWTAGANNRGNYLSFDDIANVNEFVKSHIPGKHEEIQDYTKELYSIDGNYLKRLSNMINRSFYFTTWHLDIFSRNDGSKFILSQVEEKIYKNEPLYKYVITEIDPIKNPPKVLDQKIFFSSTNIRKIKSLALRRYKLKKQLEEAKKNNSDDQIYDIIAKLKGSEWLEDSYFFVANVLFSKENMDAAIKRGDYYLGKIEHAKDQNGKEKIQRVVVDPNYGNSINCKQKTFTRAAAYGGGTFVVEQLEDIKTDMIYNKSQLPYKLHRYNLYEMCDSGNKKGILKKDSIFTDLETDLLTDLRPYIPNEFLSRSRITRKQKETIGYLGYLSKDGIKTYNPLINSFFQSRIHEGFKLTDDKFKTYYKPITFDEMKRLVTYYKLENGNVVNRYSHRVVIDEDMILRFKFANIWLKSAGIHQVVGEEIPGYTFAFEITEAENLYNDITNCISDSLRINGLIKSIEILDKVEQKNHHKKREQITINILSNKEYLSIIDKLFRLQNPSALGQTGNFEILGSNSTNELANYRQKLENLKKELLEVIPTNNGANIRKIN